MAWNVCILIFKDLSVCVDLIVVYAEPECTWEYWINCEYPDNGLLANICAYGSSFTTRGKSHSFKSSCKHTHTKCQLFLMFCSFIYIASIRVWLERSLSVNSWVWDQFPWLFFQFPRLYIISVDQSSSSLIFCLLRCTIEPL